MKDRNGVSIRGGIYRYSEVTTYELDDLIFHEGFVYVVTSPTVKGIEPPNKDNYSIAHDLSNDKGIISDMETYIYQIMNPFPKNRPVSASLIKDILRYHLGDTLGNNDLFYNEFIDLDHYFKQGIIMTSINSFPEMNTENYDKYDDDLNAIVRVSSLTHRDFAYASGDNINKVMQEVILPNGIYKWRITTPVSGSDNSNPMAGVTRWSRWHYLSDSTDRYKEYIDNINTTIELIKIVKAETKNLISNSEFRINKIMYGENPSPVLQKFCHIIMQDPITGFQQTVSKFVESVVDLPNEYKTIIYYNYD